MFFYTLPHATRVGNPKQYVRFVKQDLIGEKNSRQSDISFPKIMVLTIRKTICGLDQDCGSGSPVAPITNQD
jgi:hypothetical protein